MYIVAKAPLGGVEALVSAAQDQQLDSVFIWDYFQNFFPSAIWDEDFAWFAAESPSPHEWFEFQLLLGYLASTFRGVRLGVGITEPTSRHPAILAQAALTLAHLSQRPPILGIDTVADEARGMRDQFTHGHVRQWRTWLHEFR